MTRRLPGKVKQTSGGRFDPFDRHVYFMAAPASFILTVPPDLASYVLVAVNELRNEEEVRSFERMILEGRKVLLDSGIFSLANHHAHTHGITHNEALNLAPSEVDGFDQLYERYCKIVSRYGADLWGVIELDLGGRANKVKTRAMLERDIDGFVPIPVWHPFGDGADYLDELANGYDRICCGNIVQAAAPDRHRLMHLFYERARAYPYLWTHILGYTPTGHTSSTPPQGSCDSSTWDGSLRWGLQSAKPKAHLNSIAGTWFDHAFNRSVRVEADDPRGYLRMKDWAAYRFSMMHLTWREIEDNKRALGLTAVPVPQ